MTVGTFVALVIALSLVVEFLVQIAKDILDYIKSKDWWTVAVRIMSILFGLFVSLIANKDLLPLLNRKPLDSLGTVVVLGLIISAGSAKVYDLFKRIRELGSYEKDEPVS